MRGICGVFAAQVVILASYLGPGRRKYRNSIYVCSVTMRPHHTRATDPWQKTILHPSLTEVTFLSTIFFWGEGEKRSHHLDRLCLRQIPAEIRCCHHMAFNRCERLFHPLVLGTQK